ncbi:MAG: iron-sulfur cluster carrier protein ApbC [Candidatus Pelagadaptatus aseana]|uniref:iron-sulfur cluster carrier protein ApbC n=1 Tax=Candidatus Pelagadaptatus aseana TaxID=3120508 RepID=UPI0039B1F484
MSENSYPSAESPLQNIRHVIAVASGKGGVGKSTTTVNMALALAAQGARVGVLDADIYGPSIPMMLGVESLRPDVVDNKAMKPIAAQGIVALSMGNLVTDKTPMVWRGPMASGALMQLLTQTLWPELDYLLIDMPPGTGDIQLTLSQKVPLTGAVIVSTPQDIALLDAKKGIEMFTKVKVPVLGVVENMAVHVCSQCGHEEHIFGAEGGNRIAREYQTTLLGALPLDLSIREGGDAGKPVVAAKPDSSVAKAYLAIAAQLRDQVENKTENKPQPTIIIADD